MLNTCLYYVPNDNKHIEHSGEKKLLFCWFEPSYILRLNKALLALVNKTLIEMKDT